MGATGAGLGGAGRSWAWRGVAGRGVAWRGLEWRRRWRENLLTERTHLCARSGVLEIGLHPWGKARDHGLRLQARRRIGV